jgi:hypothetical protein
MDKVSDHDVDEAAHYCRYAFAAYGYLLYIWAQPQYKYPPPPQSSPAPSYARLQFRCIPTHFVVNGINFSMQAACIAYESYIFVR